MAILLIYVFKEAFEYGVRYMNLSYMKKHGLEIPPEFEGVTDKEFLKKIINYESDKTMFGLASSMFENIIAIIFFFGGVLNAYNSWIASFHLPFIVSGWLFFILLSFGSEFLSIPFSIYGTFRIENRYGFNTMTMRLWISDFAKSIILSAVIMSAALFAGLYLIQSSPHYWWLLIWGFLLIFSVFMMYISPYVIEPLFNKFTPVEDETLREMIKGIAEKAGIHAGSILKIDASKRSRHTNAYFTGIGKTKRIVLYDTLLTNLSHDEIIAVLAHEAGHWKRKHLLKTIVSFEIISFVGIFISYLIVGSDVLTKLFSISSDTLFAKFLIIAFLSGILSVAFAPAANYFMRRNERQADKISYELTGKTSDMIGALIKLSKGNLSNLHPHPLYATLYYSHPPVIERIRHIKGFARGSGKK